MPICSECELDECESHGKWIIFSGEDNNLKWSFQCLVCIRAWRERALKRQGLPRDKILAKLNAEYPLVRSVSDKKKIDLNRANFFGK